MRGGGVIADLSFLITQIPELRVRLFQQSDRKLTWYARPNAILCWPVIERVILDTTSMADTSRAS